MFEKFINKKVDNAVNHGIEKVKENANDIVPVMVAVGIIALCFMANVPAKATIINNYYIYGGNFK